MGVNCKNSSFFHSQIFHREPSSCGSPPTAERSMNFGKLFNSLQLHTDWTRKLIELCKEPFKFNICFVNVILGLLVVDVVTDKLSIRWPWLGLIDGDIIVTEVLKLVESYSWSGSLSPSSTVAVVGDRGIASRLKLDLDQSPSSLLVCEINSPQPKLRNHSSSSRS